MIIKLGMNCRAYRNSGTYGSPTWVVNNDIRDLTLIIETGEADVTTRGNNGWEAMVATLKKGSIDTECIWDSSNTEFKALFDAFLTNSVVEMAFLDGDIASNGSQGLRASFSVVKCSRKEPLTEAVKAEFNLKPTYAANGPLWVNAAGGALTTYTTG